MEREAARKLMMQLNALSQPVSATSKVVLQISGTYPEDFGFYLVWRIDQLRAGAPLPKEIMDDVPFFVKLPREGWDADSAGQAG